MDDIILNRLLSHIQSKKIIVSDIKRLSRSIINGNYNRVIKPFLKLVSDHGSNKITITSNDLLNLYELDKRISLLLLTHLFEIEKRLNTQIAYTIEETYHIYDGCIFNKEREFIRNEILINCTGSMCQMSFDQLISKMTKYAHINPNTKSYENVSKNNLFLKWRNCPLDALCLTWTFSTTALVYFALNDQLKKKIVRFFKMSNNKIANFDNLVNNFLSLRNLITHNNSLLDNIFNFCNEQMVENYNCIFRTRKQTINFNDFLNIVEYFSGIQGLNEELEQLVSSYKFEPTVKKILFKILNGK